MKSRLGAFITWRKIALAAALTAVLVVLIPGVVLAGKGGGGGSGGESVEAGIRAFMDDVNAQLEVQGAGFRLGVVEYFTAKDEQGRTVSFSDVGNKQLTSDFVPGDSRRTLWSGVGPGDDITWTSDLVDGDAGVGLAPTQAAIGSAMATWQGVNCSNIPLTNVATVGDLGFAQFMVTGGASGSPFPSGIFADITHAGFGTPVDAFLPPPIIAAAITFVFFDIFGPTDIDGNGKVDTAFVEIYYTFNFPWGIDTVFPIDVETIALHESGHGLSQAHFGKLFKTDKNGEFQFAPRAVMNSGYTGIQQSLAGTDKGGHCGNWANWPNN